MKTIERLDSDLKDAMRARDEVGLLVLRMLKSDLKYKQIELGRELSEEEALTVLSSAAKKRKESIEEYGRGNRQDLVEKEQAELEVISRYLPEQLSAEELYGLVDKAIAETQCQLDQGHGGDNEGLDAGGARPRRRQGGECCS